MHGRHELFRAPRIGGEPPSKPIEFDAVLKDVLGQRFRSRASGCHYFGGRACATTDDNRFVADRWSARNEVNGMMAGSVVQAGVIQQVVVPGLEAVPVPRQSPGPTPDFVGRDVEVAALDSLLTATGTSVVRVVEGTAGVGKTTLAVWWAHKVPDTAPPLHRMTPRPDFPSGFTGDEIRGVLRIATAASLGRRAAVHLLTFTAVPDQPGFGDLVRILDLVWDMGDTVRMGQVTDWAAVVGLMAAASVPDRDRQMIAVAASLAGGPSVDLEAAVSFVDDPAAAQRVIEAFAIATGHGNRWELTERPAPSADT